MSKSTRFIRVHQDALVEYIWDDTFFYEDEYSIVRDTQNNVTSFAFSKDNNDPQNYNKIPNQLYLVDALINKYGIADPDKKPFLQESKYVNNQPSKFNKIKIWFPIHYTFPNSTGFYLRTYAMNYENAVEYNLSNFFLDVSNQTDLNKIENEPQLLRLYDRLWGKTVTIYVPALYDESRNRLNNSPTLGTINHNLTSGNLGLSQTSPIFLDFRFLTNKMTVLGETSYLATTPLITSIPQAPEYNNLAVRIEEAGDGDYFRINGIFNGTAGGFDAFMSTLEESGKRCYILYSITVFEENIPQEPREIYVYKDFYKGIDDYRPVLKHTNTTASVQVEMKLINSYDSSIISRVADYSIAGNNVAKYGKYVTPINVANAIKPKLYNSKPNQLILPAKELIQHHIKRKGGGNAQVRYVPYPVLTNVHNTVAQDVSVRNKNDIYYGYGDLELVLTPFDNIVKIRIAKSIRADVHEPFVLPATGTIIQMVFKSATSELRVPLYMESNEVDLSNGVLVFKIAASHNASLRKIFQTNKNFYITTTTNGIENSVYDGRFTMLDEQPRPRRDMKDMTPKDNRVVQVARPTPMRNDLAKINARELKLLPVSLAPQPISKTLVESKLSVAQLNRMK
jgi:hypothetical protein